MYDNPLPQEFSTEKVLILVVEDDTGVRESLEMLLSLEGFQVSVARSVNNALRLITCNHYRPDLILSDYSLPKGETGHDLIQHIRQMTDSFIPAVLLTADRSYTRIAEAQQMGYCLLYKPVDADTLIKTLSDTLYQQ